VGRALALGVLLGLALAAGCPSAPYALKTPLGRLVGAGLVYQGGALTLTGACLEAEGLRFQSPRIVYRKASGRLSARAPRGELRGFRFQAKSLTADDGRVELADARFVRGGLRVTARRARVEGAAVVLAELAARTPRYRFTAARGRLAGGRFVAEGVAGTPCRAGDALALSGRRAVFDVATGRLLMEASEVRYYGVCLARPARLLLDTRRPPRLALPLRFSLEEGLSLGVEGLPLPEEGVPLGEGRTRLTLLAEHLGGGEAGVTFGLAREGAGFRMGLDAGGGFALKVWAPGVRSERRADGTAYLALAPAFALGPLTLAPTVATVDAGGAYLGYGLEARARLAGRVGEAAFTLAPWALALAYPDAPAFAGVGADVSVAYRGLRLRYARSHRIGAPRSFWEAGRVAEVASAGLAYGPFGLDWYRDFAAGWSRVAARWQGPVWLRLQKGFGGQAARLEAVLGYRAPDPGPGGLALSPSLGYDFGLGRVSRAGLTLALADRCLVYRLTGGAVWAPWPGETPGVRFALGLSLL